MVDTHKCLSCGETMTEEQAKSVSGCPFCYTRKSIVMRAPTEVGENHQEKVTMAKKSVATKAAAKPAAAKKAPKVEKVAAKVVESKQPVVKDEITLVDTPPAKKGVKEYAKKVLADKAAKEGTPESPVAKEIKKSEVVDAKEAERLEKLAKKENALAAFTKNGAPAATGDDEFDAIQTKAYNDYVSKCKADIAALNVPTGTASHFVKFDKNGVAQKISAEEGAKALSKVLSKEAKAQTDPDANLPACVCKKCAHNEGAEKCKKCHGESDSACLIPDLPCKEKRANGRQSCVQNAIDQGYSTRFVAQLKQKWQIDQPIKAAKPVEKKQLAPADAPNTTKLVARKKA